MYTSIVFNMVWAILVFSYKGVQQMNKCDYWKWCLQKMILYSYGPFFFISVELKLTVKWHVLNISIANYKEIQQTVSHRFILSPNEHTLDWANVQCWVIDIHLDYCIDILNREKRDLKIKPPASLLTSTFMKSFIIKSCGLL